MMHAYLRLKGFRNLSIEVEEGICQVLSHLWLESEIIAGSSSNVASSSAASSSSSSAPTTSKKGAKTEFEKKLGAFITRSRQILLRRMEVGSELATRLSSVMA
ncbi:unnamed protein product [Urochloa humidicola]